MKPTHTKKKEKIPLATAMWAEVYESLIKSGVKFPKNFDGIGAAYGGFITIEKVLRDYKISPKRNNKR